jgi:hypothetical protein
MAFHAYLHARPDAEDASGVFYVGKGKGLKRARTITGRNKYHAAIVEKHGRENILIGRMFCSSEQTAFDLEVGLIKCLKRMSVRLANMTDGGEGASGNVGSDKQRQNMISINAKLTPEERIANRKKEPSDTDKRRSESGKIARASMSDETKRSTGMKISANNLSSWNDPEVREKRTSGMKGKKKTQSPAAIAARKANLAKAHAAKQAKKEL